MGDHTECIQVDFAPEVLGYAELLEHFWRAHAPHRPPGRGQYRSVLLVETPAQRAAAEASARARSQADGRPVLTPIEDLGAFTRAEDYHQKYALRRHRDFAGPLLEAYGEGDAFTDSTAATRLNASLGGYGDPDQLRQELPALGLSAAAEARLRQQVLPRLGPG